MDLNRCAFTTDRLHVRGWHAPPPDPATESDLASAVAALLTPGVTAPLPEGWQGDYSVERARDWIRDRDAESSVLLVTERVTDTPVGLVILTAFPHPDDEAATDIRLGYLLGEGSWGRGYASELVAGLASWCAAESDARSLTGGVARDNHASIRVLQKNGFELLEEEDPPAEEALYRLTLPG